MQADDRWFSSLRLDMAADQEQRMMVNERPAGPMPELWSSTEAEAGNQSVRSPRGHSPPTWWTLLVAFRRALSRAGGSC